MRARPDFELDPQLQRDGFVLGKLDGCHLLLLNNAAVPWFVLVPETAVTELIDLDSTERARVRAATDAVAVFVRDNFAVDKLNVAAIGNVVSQLHVHVVGRCRDDYCWPDVVWGRSSGQQYTDDQVAEIRRLATAALGLAPAMT